MDFKLCHRIDLLKPKGWTKCIMNSDFNFWTIPGVSIQDYPVQSILDLLWPQIFGAQGLMGTVEKI